MERTDGETMTNQEYMALSAELFKLELLEIQGEDHSKRIKEIRKLIGE